MEARVSDLTKKPFKGWKNLFQIFLNETIFEKAQQNDNGLSCFLMGLYYELGCMVDQNYDLALQYFRLGANKRDPLCLYKLYEIHSAKSFYDVEPDHEIALLYLVWAVVYAFPVYGSYMCLDFDLELQSYYKFALKQDKQYVFNLIDNYDDDIFAHDKELIKCVFEFLIEFVSPSLEFSVQKGYQKMIDRLVELAEINDPRFVALFLFKCVLWDFKGVTDRNHSRISELIRQKKCISFIFEQLRGVFDYISLVNKRHTIFLRLLHFHSIEIFLQIKYNSDPDDIANKEDAFFYLINFLNKNLCLMDNNFSKSMAVYFVAKSHLNGKLSPKNVSLAINVIESSRSLPGFTENDFPFVLGGRLYSEAGNNAASEKCFEKYLDISDFTTNLPSKLYEQGKYFEYCKQDTEKALQAYLKGLQPTTDINTFVQECFAKKCRAKILKLVRSNEELQSKLDSPIQKAKLLQDFGYCDVTYV